jgi:outer membrane protein assembly factor BamB
MRKPLEREVALVVIHPCRRGAPVKRDGFAGASVGERATDCGEVRVAGMLARQAGGAAGKGRTAMARNREILYVGTGRFVAAIDAKTGEEIWRTKLPHATGNIVTILLKDGRLYVGHAGRAYCLNQQDGSLLWENGLAKMGFGAVLLAMEGAQGCDASGAAAVVDAEARARARSSGA